MALRQAILKRAGVDSGSVLGLRRWVHASALPPPLDASITPPTASQPLVLPESDRIPDNDIGFGFQSFPFVGSMELMAVPKRKTSRHKRGIRNGPRALKPIPVIIRCNEFRTCSLNLLLVKWGFKQRRAVVELSCHTSSVAVVIAEILVNKMAHPVRHVCRWASKGQISSFSFV
ncbi:Ribosomal protein L32p [Corchorus olitorius]|uniref:Large ribosomal subunit protein bL32m n=1 Tax=Corchorus olitorius TaxID=93759 RepID=A0A1R3H2I8_9ROSI|nr:Ribosomal protein L32p [Corchorus olitorius]